MGGTVTTLTNNYKAVLDGDVTVTALTNNGLMEVRGDDVTVTTLSANAGGIAVKDGAKLTVTDATAFVKLVKIVPAAAGAKLVLDNASSSAANVEDKFVDSAGADYAATTPATVKADTYTATVVSGNLVWKGTVTK